MEKINCGTSLNRVIPTKYRKEDKMDQCPVCKKFIFRSDPKPHKCPPKFEVGHEDYLGEDKETIYTYSHQEAAEKYGEWYDSRSDHELLDGEEIDVTVSGEGETKKFRVGGECVPEYRAIEIS
jgi:hypothetical protein